MDPALQALLGRLDPVSDQFRELKDGVQMAVKVAELDPEMALTRCRKVLEIIVRDLFDKHIQEPAGTQPLEGLLQRLFKNDHLPPLVNAYANGIRELGNIGTHKFQTIAVGDVSNSLSQLISVVEWYAQGAPGNPEPTKKPPKPSAPEPAKQPLAIVPKGLRSFDAGDAKFFLELLPGPRDEKGLPESIRFWKHRIEQEITFTVGVIYGPSGCGKSSLVKAGLLPKLGERVFWVYVEAAAEDTEARLLRALRKRCPNLPADLDLTASLLALRQGKSLNKAQKVLIVLDQFEQWLHATQGQEDTELARALRQCDGERVQALVTVREDFWVGVSRFMGDLGTKLLDGQNACLVDLFNQDHARKVLAAFGRAFGRVQEEPTRDQQAFIDQAVEGLSHDGRVICVRLALFAEMVKGKPWTPATLKEVGGTAGVGVTFLEETFSSAVAGPRNRLHQEAARAVLKALLPEQGTNIKGNMQSQSKLLQASGYAGRPKDFEELLWILDSEVRLITPTDPPGVEANAPTPEKYYQLTHDYLVHSLRDWLTRKQKETRRGRAELRLAERAALWSAKPESRHLPAWWEWATIRILTRQRDWSSPQRKMMRKATRYHALRGLVLALLLLVVTLTGLRIRGQVIESNKATHAAGLVRQLLDAEIAQVPGIIKEMQDYRQWTDKLLKDEYAKAVAQNDSRKQLHASLALLPVDSGQVDYLHARLLDAEPQEVGVLRDSLLPQKNQLVDRLWTIVEQPPKGYEDQRLRAACALATFDPDSARWAKVSGPLVEQLVSINAVYLDSWLEGFRPVKERLVVPLSVLFRDRKEERTTERSLATSILANYAADQPDLLADLVQDADEKQFSVLYPKLDAHRERALALMNAGLDKQSQPHWIDPPLDPSWKVPDGALVQKIETAHGLLTERFAFCQTMPLEDFLAVADRLRSSGYRPSCFRPYMAGKAVLVAAVWTRDGRDCHLAQGLSSEEVRKQDADQQNQGYQPVDVNGYLQHAGNSSAEYFAVLWVKGPRDSGVVQLEIGLEKDRLKTRGESLRQGGFRLTRLCQFVGGDGKARFGEIWAKAAGQTGKDYGQFDMIEANYSGESHLGELQVDIQVSKAPRLLTTQERYSQQLQEAEEALLDKPADAQARFRQAVAYFYLGEEAGAVEDLDRLVKKFPKEPEIYYYRAMAQARLGKGKDAKDDLARFLALSNNAAVKLYLEVVVLVYLRDEDAAMKKLETTFNANAQDPNFLYKGACAYAIASQVVAQKELGKGNPYEDRAIALLKKAVAKGYSDFRQMQTESDFDPIRQNPGFVAILHGGKLERRYAAVWHVTPSLTSTEGHGLDPKEHLARCQDLIAQDYRPASLSVDEVGAGQPLVTASVWHRPVVLEKDKESLAKRQANAAVTLLRMGQADKMWPLLQHRPDSRLRSYLIHRFSPLGVDPGAIVQRLNEEKEVSIRRALLLILGEFGSGQISPADREPLIPKVLQLYRDDPDPGLHGAAECLLRQWGQQEKLKEFEQAWARDEKKQQRKERQEQIRRELARETGRGEGYWYVNGQAQTMVAISGPVEFLMGSPPTEEAREGGPEGKLEQQHRKRIGRSFAVATKEVTVKQFREFLNFRKENIDAYYNKTNSPTVDCPVNEVSWYDAAAYCNWLSEQEGIPKEQWCFEANPEGKYAEGMKLAPDYLEREGYRLPSEAEWEYACRAGAMTSRYCGETEDLLGKYAWYMKNSQARGMLPGVPGELGVPGDCLKPNDLGLFDMLGNAIEWCQDSFGDYSPGENAEPSEDVEDNNYIKDNKLRVMRGGSFNDRPVVVRSAFRFRELPTIQSHDVGFRPARTFR